MKKILVILFMFTLTSSFASAIYSKSLRSLVKKSHVIAYGKVIKTYPTNFVNKNNFKDIAEVEIIELIKGKPQAKIIRILYDEGISCPPSPKFVINTNVLTLLLTENEMFFSSGFSSGVKTLKQAEYEIYKNRILEIEQINNISDINIQNIQTKSWAITCLTNPLTKQEGIWELKRDEIVKELTEENILLLKDLFFSKHEFDYNSDFIFSDILKKDYQREVEKHLIDNLILVDNKDVMYVFEDYYDSLFHLGNKELNLKLRIEFEKYMDYGEENEKKMMSLKNEFVKNIKS